MEIKASNKSRIKVKEIKAISRNLRTNSSCSDDSCCCGSKDNKTAQLTTYNINDPFITDEIVTDTGKVPQISTKLMMSDKLGALRVRFGINRMDYKVNPGIYAIGTPNKESLVLVTANYKLTFDTLRKELSGLNLWIVVLDTKGVNVWCAAGKGTFGTIELINRVSKTRLSEIVSHRTLILPQLGASGISAHEVTKNTGFKVIYGPVRAADIKTFINSELKATKEMRTVKFTTLDRLKLTPIEITNSLKPSITILAIMFLINLIAVNKFGITDFYSYIGTLLIGCLITPVLLPWIPGRAFALKGWTLGLLWAVFVVFINGWPTSESFGLLKGIGYLLALPSASAYFAMNFTGSSTYTSLSGVLKEMIAVIPPIVVTISLGALLLIVDCFIKI